MYLYLLLSQSLDKDTLENGDLSMNTSASENNQSYQGLYGTFDWDEVYFEYKGVKYSQNEMPYMYKTLLEGSGLTTTFDFSEIIKPAGLATERSVNYKDMSGNSIISFSLLNFSNKDLSANECPITEVSLFPYTSTEFSICGLKIGDTFEDVYRVLGRPDTGEQGDHSWVYYNESNPENTGNCLYIIFDSGKIKAMNLLIYDAAETEMKNYFNNDDSMFNFD